MDKSKQIDIIKNVLKKEVYETHDRIGFGKYKHKKLIDILKKDRKYLIWLSSQNIHYELKNKINRLLNN